MNFIVIGNIIMFVASVVMVLAGFCKSRKLTIILQTVQMGIMAAGTLCLGGFSGAIMNCFSAVRNILSYNGKLDTKAKIALIVISSCIALSVNNLGIIGFIPIIVFIMFALFMNAEDVVYLKLITSIGCVLFFVHDLYIQSYTSAIFNAVTVMTNVSSIVYILVQRAKTQSEINKAIA